MIYSKHLRRIFFLFSFIPFLTNAQTLLDIEIGVNNIPITEVEFIYNGSTVVQTSGVTGTNTVAVGPARLVQMKIDDGGSTTILYPNSFGSVIANNNFTPAVTGVGVYSDGTFTPASNAALWEPAMLEVVDSNDLMNFLYYDGTSNLPGGDDFDVLFVKGIQDDDYVVIGERNGNTYFTVTPLDANSNPITTAKKLRFGHDAGTSSGNGTNFYDWDIGLSPTNYPAQSMVYTVVDAELFDTGGSAVYGFRIDNNGEADVKFYGLSDSDFSDNPANPSVAGITGNVFNDDNGLMDNTVDGIGIDDPESTQLYAILYDGATNIQIDNFPINADGSYEFLNLDPADYDVLISELPGTNGSTVPAAQLPADWIYTGDFQGTGPGNDGTVDGIQTSITVLAGTLETEVNFGIEKTPEADDYTYTIANPDLNEFYTIGTGATSDLTGTDYEDGAKGTGDEFGITSLPTNGNEIYYNGTEITLGDDGINPPSATNPFTIANYDPSLLEIKFTNPASTSTAFNYTTTDAADETSPEATYTLNYAALEKGSLSGTVFNDANGLVNSTVDGTAFDDPDGSQLYATIYETGTTTVLATQAIAADGTYLFDNLVPNTDYNVIISTNTGTPGSAIPTIAIPTDWMHTGDNLGTGAGNDGTPDGSQMTLSVGTTELPNVNFGIQKTPEADDYTYTIANPDLNELYTIGTGATSDLTGTDNEDGAKGTGDEFGITSLPTNGNEIYYNGTEITLGDDGINPPSATNPFTIANYDPSLLEIKFTNPASTSTAFNYTTTDAADETSPEATYTLNYAAVEKGSLSGTVFNDADGLVNSTVDGTAFDDPDGSQLYATIYETGTTTVLASQAIAADGTYLFDNLVPNTDYNVIISTITGTPGSAIPTIAIPTDWMHTGDNLGTGAGNDGTPDGSQVTLSVGTTELPNVNFGIQKLPTADDYTYTIPDPILNSFMEIGVGAKSGLSGDDFEDGAFNDGEKFGITSLPTNGNELYYMGTQITVGDDGINPPSPSNPFTIPVYNQAFLQMKFTGNGSTTTSFDYVTIDAAGEMPTTPATYTMNYSAVVSGSLSGTVFNDADGLTDSTVDGIGIDDPETTQLYATLFDATSDEVLASIPVAADGTFLFTELTPDSNYGVLISTNQGVVGPSLPTISLPTDWVNTGEFRGTGTGDDGMVNGTQTALSVGTSLLPNVNFGINKIPEADDYTFGIDNPVPDSYFTIGSGATSDLSGDDNEDGVLGTNDKFGITSLPTSGNELYYNGAKITLGQDGTNPPSATNPFVIDNYDPTLLEIKFSGGPQSSTSFDYVAIDEAGFADATPATYELSYSALPVEWAAFTATKNGESADIYFATSSEKDNNLFFVQKSLDGENFRNIHTILGQGTSDYLSEYYFVDPVLNLGLNYYRIAQIDYDGSMSYTEVQTVMFDATHSTMVYPNPAPINSEVKVKYYSGEETIIATVTNMLGVVVKSIELNNPGGWNETSIELNNLAAGTYALRIGDRQNAVIFNIAE